MTALDTCVGRGPVLLIDDDELIAGSFRDYLRARGWTVDVAVEPAAAEALMGEREYEVIVVDPYLTGGVHAANASLLTSIRARQPHSPIVVLTGYDSPALLQIAATDQSTATSNHSPGTR